ncbi:MAG: ferrous iron transporter B [Ruminococcaceae bacterium]|nr:ferrous iron transporter B [Oscillospiraceae bacterium]
MSSRVVALAGSPNVGKSTVFNELTGMHRHTGNWIGKTVDTKASHFYYKFNDYSVVDLPGTYSMHPQSGEEEVARRFLVEEKPDCIVCVVDSTLLERSLPLVFQLLSLTDKAVVLLNLSDEAEKKGIYVDAEKLSEILGVPVVKSTARSGKGINNLLENIHLVTTGAVNPHPLKVGGDVYRKAKEIAADTVRRSKPETVSLLDRIVLGRVTSFISMALIFALMLWITISLSNYPSELLKYLFDKLEILIAEGMRSLHISGEIISVLVYGVLRVLFWVVSVMLPPMAIFFPLFALMEDFGLLPRIAFNLDFCFEKCGACGKQSLCTCMGLGCNAVGVTGARIIDSPRERLIAIMTNSLTPCNGRFPILIAVIGMFFARNSFVAALILLGFILLSLFGTMLASKLLSVTVLKGYSSSFVMELPPYRRPQIMKTVAQSLKQKVVFVLLRAVVVAAPAGLVIWLCANIRVGDASVLSHLSSGLDGIGRALGMDGVILLAFLLGFPANEIVIPIMLMAYLSSGTLADFSSANSLLAILVAHGWTAKTAICTCVFTLFHFPCSTTLLTVFKETKSMKWTALSVIVPLLLGAALCFILNIII